jgi:hypothetical protein
MHVLFLAPDTHVYNHGFLRALKALGAKVSAIGMTSAERLSPADLALQAFRLGVKPATLRSAIESGALNG